MSAPVLLVAALLAPQVPAPRGAPPPPAALPSVKSVAITSARSPVGSSRGTAVTGGQEVVLRVELTGPAPCVERCGSTALDGTKSGYMPVAIASSNATQVPVQRVLVSTGEVAGEVKFVTSPVTETQAITISAQAAGSAAQRAMLSVLAPTLVSFAVDRSDVKAGEVVKAVATFTGPPASASAVKLVVQTTNSTVLRVPSSVMLEPGKVQAAFDITSLGLEQDASAHVVATYLDRNLPASISVRAATLKGVSNVNPCCDNPMRIALDAVAPPNGAVIKLTSEDPARVAVPATVTIPSGQSDISVSATQTPSPSGDKKVGIAISYRGETKHWKIYSWKLIKPDLVIDDHSLQDRFGAAIQAPADGQPFKLCVVTRVKHEDAFGSNGPAGPSVTRISYRTPTGTGTSTGRDVDVPVVFSGTSRVTQCIDVPGLPPGGEHQIDAVADVLRQVDEAHEGNNDKHFKVKRPSTP